METQPLLADFDIPQGQAHDDIQAEPGDGSKALVLGGCMRKALEDVTGTVELSFKLQDRHPRALVTVFLYQDYRVFRDVAAPWDAIHHPAFPAALLGYELRIVSLAMPLETVLNIVESGIKLHSLKELSVLIANDHPQPTPPWELAGDLPVLNWSELDVVYVRAIVLEAQAVPAEISEAVTSWACAEGGLKALIARMTNGCLHKVDIVIRGVDPAKLEDFKSNAYDILHEVAQEVSYTTTSGEEGDLFQDRMDNAALQSLEEFSHDASRRVVKVGFFPTQMVLRCTGAEGKQDIAISWKLICDPRLVYALRSTFGGIKEVCAPFGLVVTMINADIVGPAMAKLVIQLHSGDRLPPGLDPEQSSTALTVNSLRELHIAILLADDESQSLYPTSVMSSPGFRNVLQRVRVARRLEKIHFSGVYPRSQARLIQRNVTPLAPAAHEVTYFTPDGTPIVILPGENTGFNHRKWHYLEDLVRESDVLSTKMDLSVFPFERGANDGEESPDQSVLGDNETIGWHGEAEEGNSRPEDGYIEDVV
ncbi:hypothetical protein AURDEDRAFT_130832 [Auricularia subglabra TFB-10046 SS5]|uniref:Uncharacterized protein n=1 Tax=Auricularia subglabra (strain TFB-10046 / SS5) TaxID=717982 RepID=J0LE28_AURST|nr:hypothetical protein AURDEDRAFT_130832 [Auricularia subglabra TFB-10046 SS5]